MSALEGLSLYKPMTYEQYLESHRWRSVRAQALLRAGNRCALNPSHTGVLEVRHSTRERLGQERDCDLIVLCESCAQLVGPVLGGNASHDGTTHYAISVSVPPPAESAPAPASARIAAVRAAQRNRSMWRSHNRV